MANGYIGKISAVVTANTADLSAKLRSATGDVDKFAQSLNRSISASAKSAEASLQGIFTPLQQIERRLKTALEANLRTDKAANQIRSLVSASEQLNKPLTSAAKQFAGLSLDVQAAFLPALKQAQNAVIGVNAAIESTGGVSAARFARASGEVAQFSASLSTVLDALRKVAALQTGNELEFQFPRLNASLAAAQTAGRNAASLPAGAIAADPQIEGLVRQINRVSQAAVEAAARLKAAASGAEVSAATAEYNTLNATIERLTARLNKKYRVVIETQEAQAAARALRSDLDQLFSGRVQNLDQAEAAFKRLRGEIEQLTVAQRKAFSGNLTRLGEIVSSGGIRSLGEARRLIAQIEADLAARKQLNIDTERAKSTLRALRDEAKFTITATPQNFNQVSSVFQKLRSDIEQLDVAQRKVFSGSLNKLASLIASGDTDNLDEARRLIDDIQAKLTKRTTLNLNAESAKKSLDAIRGRLGDIATQLGAPPTDPYELLRRNADEAKQAIDRVTSASRKQKLEARLASVAAQIQSDSQNPNLTDRQAARRAAQRAAALARITESASVTRGEDIFGPAINSGEARLDSLKGRITSLQAAIAALPAPLQSGLIPAINQVRTAFANIDTSRPSAGIRQLVSQVEDLEAKSRRAASATTFRQTFGGTGAAGISANFDDQLLRGYTAQLELLQQTLGRASASARVQGVQSFARLRDAIVEAMTRGELATAKTQKRIELFLRSATRDAAKAAGVGFGQLERKLSRVGDVARGSFSNAGLAIQQAVFAFEDFFSVTGGLDQRIRAAGNNLSQLGFILGGTTGLFVGVGVAIAGQAVAGLIRWYTEADKAEAATKRMNDALNSQRSRTEELANAYRDLAEAIARAGLSEREREQAQRRDPIRNIERTQEQRRRDIAASNLPVVGSSAARIDAIDKQLEQEENILNRRRLLRERERLSRRVDSQIEGVVQRGLGFANTAQRFQGANAIRVLIEGRGGLNQVQRDLRRAEASGDSAAVSRLSRELTALTVAIQVLRDRGVVQGFERQQAASDALARSQSELQGIPGVRIADILGREVANRFQQATEQLSAGQIGTGDFNAQAEALSEFARIIEAASIQTGAFASALSSAAGTLAQAVEQDLAQRSESLRREANAAEARFGAGDERTRLLRGQQAQVSDARVAAANTRREIDREIARRRLEFEASANRAAGINTPAGALAARIQQLEAIANAPIPDEPRTFAELSQLLAQRQSAQLEADGLRERLNALFEELPEVDALRRRADELDVAAQRALQRLENVEQGRRLTLTPAERAAEEWAQQVEQIREYANDAVENSSGLPDDIAGIRRRANDAIGRLAEEQLRQAAPAVFALADSVANALLQGPSRAALNVTDVSTVEGARELNRLLRGDDPARDQNLVELQKQSGLLQELVNQGRDRGLFPVAD